MNAERLHSTIEERIEFVSVRRVHHHLFIHAEIVADIRLNEFHLLRVNCERSVFDLLNVLVLRRKQEKPAVLGIPRKVLCGKPLSL